MPALQGSALGSGPSTDDCICQRCRVLRWDLAPALTSKTQPRTLPDPTNRRLRAPATSYTWPALSRGKRVERAGRVAMSKQLAVRICIKIDSRPSKSWYWILTVFPLSIDNILVSWSLIFTSKSIKCRDLTQTSPRWWLKSKEFASKSDFAAKTSNF